TTPLRNPPCGAVGSCVAPDVPAVAGTCVAPVVPTTGICRGGACPTPADEPFPPRLGNAQASKRIAMPGTPSDRARLTRACPIVFMLIPSSISEYVSLVRSATTLASKKRPFRPYLSTFLHHYFASFSTTPRSSTLSPF